MPLGPYVIMSLMILTLWAVCLRGAYVLKDVAKQRDDAKLRGDSWKRTAQGWQQRALDLEHEAQLAWHAYHGIGMGPAGWNAKDREAFKRLATVLDQYNARGKVNP